MSRKKQLKWTGVKKIAQGMELIQESVIAKTADFKSFSHKLPPQEHANFMQALIKQICKTTQDRLACEVAVENLQIWLICNHSESAIKVGIEQFHKEKNASEGIMKMVEIALTGEISDKNHQEAAYATAVLFICALAKSIEQASIDGRKTFKDAQKIIPQMTTYLLSVSNLNDYVIRLSLLHYFGYMAAHGKNQGEFEKLLNRFGYTVLDYLFSQLFKKKSEGVALQFLLENFEFFLHSSPSSQKIIHEILKYYLLKKPERSSLFLQTLGDKLHSSKLSTQQSYLQHLGALLHVVGKLNHKGLIKELLSYIYKNPHPYLSELTMQIQHEENLDDEEKEFARQLGDGYKTGSEIQSFLRSHKRGRHPSFHAIKPMEVFEQVALLGNVGNLGRLS